MFEDLVFQYAKRMLHIILPSVACSALHYILPHYLIKVTIFEENNYMECKICCDFLYKFCLKCYSF